MQAILTRSLPAFDAKTVAAGQRLSAWTDKLNELYYPLDTENPGTDFSIGYLFSTDVGGLRVGTVDSDPVLIHRRRTHVCTRASDYYLIPMPVDAPLRLHQRGREALVVPASLGIVGTSDVYTYEQRTRSASSTLRIPGAMLRDRVLGIDDWTARSFSARQPSVAMFLDFARSFCRHGPKLSGEEGLSMAHHLMDLLTLALTSSNEIGEGQETAVREAHRQRALRAIENHLGEYDLTPSRVADVVGVSERHLQRIFAERGETVSAVIRRRRVEEACRLLGSAKARGRSIAAIGYQVGFADPAYFSRVFLKETGQSPAAYRSEPGAPGP
ncbi:helix-turn-helix domain-containing protein [Chelatococcus reniformis]|uniref:AraC family transcriptional regulator n=1 Tax=Chelatococcus reniformis TaxID=1494448 RepID=A0A916TYM3_9HYPH|nr:helix-turn-helix domain-containing protein [Chelatococcus reniformis]GGC52838.1 AraC family transcriptional regulator [Chelatococcus reniformis]